jgi:hypothetical protein
MKKLFLVVLALLPVLGVGCPRWLGGTVDPASLTREEKDANAKKILFSSGDSFEIRQTLFGFGSGLQELVGSEEGLRKVVIKGFNPSHDATIEWQLTFKRETEASKEQRREYEQKLLQVSTTTVPADLIPPNIEFEPVYSTGTLEGIDLWSPHVGSLPSTWQPKKITSYEESAVWLSHDAFQELSRTGKTAFRLQSLDTPQTLLEPLGELQKAWEQLRKIQRSGTTNTDTNLLVKEGEVIDWQIEVNGRVEAVSAIKAKHWFGDLVILNHPENPLILKFTLNPLRGDLLATLDKEQLLGKLFGYEITKLKIRTF